MRASYWTQFGAMLIPVGVSLIALRPSLYILAFWLIVAGSISFVAGWAYTVRDERQQQQDREKEDNLRKEQEKRRKRSHHLDRLIQYEILKRLGVPPERVGRKYRRWLREQKLKEELNNSLGEGDDL